MHTSRLALLILLLVLRVMLELLFMGGSELETFVSMVVLLFFLSYHFTTALRRFVLLCPPWVKGGRAHKDRLLASSAQPWFSMSGEVTHLQAQSESGEVTHLLALHGSGA